MRHPFFKSSRQKVVSGWFFIGIGSRFRGDDAVGCLLADELAAAGLAAIEHSGEPTSLIDDWQGPERVMLLDAVFSGAAPGIIHHFDLRTETLPAAFSKPTTHAIGIAEAVEFARALGKLPPKIEFYGIEGQSFDYGRSLSPPVQEALEKLKGMLLKRYGSG
ncbi:MAG: hydrogenase maturation protease [Alphaproteobacteria bacterium]|nr:hydrogenase maturation protease [Alphaproteobacteria bacterium]